MSSFKGRFGRRKGCLKNTALPQGVQIQEYAPRERLDPDGKGIEAYRPLHEYDLSAQGTVSGGVKEVYDLLCKAGRFDVVELGELELVYGKELI